MPYLGRFLFSHLVGPRKPFRRDLDLDYDIDSDEEWEEVPGISVF